MPVELKVPQVGESITEVQIGEWFRAEGQRVDRDQPVVVIESDKATVEVPAPVTGIVAKILKQRGATASVGEVIAVLEEAAAQTQPIPAPPSMVREAAAATQAPQTAPAGVQPIPAGSTPIPAAVPPPPPVPVAAPAVEETPAVSAPVSAGEEGRKEEIVPMSPMRKRIAQRLVEAQQNAALLTTFNEVDMSAVMTLREELREIFMARYGVKLGFMSFFVKATIDALKLVPQLNAEIRGANIVYRNYHDIGIAIGAGKGLVVPILRNAERMSFAQIEKAIAEYAGRAQQNKIKIEELRGGTFTITNGGVFGSMLSTPIVNPPQSGILGLHAIQDRAVVREKQIVIRPMMYIALTYDHRLVDGREAVTFLKRVKECIEKPPRMLLEA